MSSALHNNETLIGISRIAPGASATLATLLAAASSGQIAVQSGLRRIVLVPASGTTNLALGSPATAASSVVPSAGIDMPFSERDAVNLNLYSAAGSVLDVFQYGKVAR